MSSRQVLGLLLAGVILVQLTSAIVLIDSRDWRTTYLGILYASGVGEESYVVSSLGDLDVFTRSIPKNESVTIIEDTKSPVIKNTKRYLELRGYKNVETVFVGNPYAFQFDIASKLGARCHVVVPSNFGIYAISVFPYARLNNCSAIFWDYGYKDMILGFLKSADSRGENITFFGDFEERPWVLFPRARLIDVGNAYDNNKRMVEILMGYKQIGDKHWAILVKGDRIEGGYLSEGLPIVVFDGDVGGTVNFLKKVGIKHLEVIGPDMMDTATAIREGSKKSIGVVVKFGRTFTGIPELKGKVYPLNDILAAIPSPHLSVYKIYYDNVHGKLAIVFKDDGNTKVLFYTPVVNLKREGVILDSLSDESIYGLYPGQFFTLTFNTTKDMYNDSFIAELHTIYGFQEPLNMHIGEGAVARYNVSVRDLNERSRVELVDVFYDARFGRIVIKVKNLGEEPVYVFGQLLGFYYGKENVTLVPRNYTYLEPGQTGEMVIPGYLLEDEIDRNKEVQVKLIFGKEYPLLVNSLEERSVLKVIRPGIIDAITGLIIAAVSNPLFYVILVVIVLAWIYRDRLLVAGKRRKKRKR